MSLDYYITMLGGFKISRDDDSVTAPEGRTGKPWNLLEYIVFNRKRHIPQDELEKLLWDEAADMNPAGALKVLLHRTRNILKEISPEDGADLIVLKHGEYYWNENVRIVTDVEQFENAYAAAMAEKDDNDRVRLLEAALGIYKGDFLPDNSERWTVPFSAKYHEMYVDTVKRLADLVEAGDDYEKLASLCSAAVNIEKQDESLYRRLIYALYMLGRQEEALEQYRRVTDMFYSSFSVTPSDELKDLYKILMRTMQTFEADINVIKDNLTEQGTATGAFECEYGVFRDVYQLEARACARSGDSIYLCLVTLEPAKEHNIAKSDMNRGVGHLHKAISETLRKGDAFSRYSVSQYIILLPAASYENVRSVLKRISTAFKRKHGKKDLVMVSQIQPIDPKL